MGGTRLGALFAVDQVLMERTYANRTFTALAFRVMRLIIYGEDCRD